MSFCVDLWNGFDIIKNQFNNTQKKLKTLSKFLSSYITIETNNCKSLEYLYKEFKDTSEPEFLLDESFKKVIEIFDYESQHRKTYYNNLIKIVLEPLNAYLDKPKFILNKCFSDNIENTDIFNRLLNILIEKQTVFHNQCKELSSQVALLEIDKINKTNKTQISKCKKFLDKVKYSKEDYINCLKETNKEREKFNQKTEEILNNLEEMYTEMIEKMHNSLYNFTTYRLEFYQSLIRNEQKEFNETHSKIVPEKEILDFIIKNATKEFPLIKFEFCSLKFSVLNNFVKNKYYNKIPEKEFKNVYKAIKNYFDTNSIFKDDLGLIPKQKTNDFFTRRFTFFGKKPQNNNQNIEEMKEKKENLEKFITELFTGNNNQTKKEKDKNNQKDEEDKTKEKNETKENAESKSDEKLNADKPEIIETSEKKSDNLDEQKKEELVNANDDKLEKTLDDKKEKKINNTDNNINYCEEKNEEDLELNNKEKNKNENESKDNSKKENKEEVNNKIENKEENKEEKNNILENKEKDNKNDKNENLENKNNVIEDQNKNNINNEENKIENENQIKKKDLDFGDLIKLIYNTNENSFFYIETLIKKLSYLRSIGIFKISDYAYKLILALFGTILYQNPKNDYILKNVLILCQTFYKLQDNQKIYLQEGVKNREIFKSPEIWHRVINYSMNLSCSDKDLTNLKSNEIIEKVNKESDVVVIAYLCDIKQYTDDEKVFNDVKDYYIKVYNMDKEKVDKEVEEYMKTLNKVKVKKKTNNKSEKGEVNKKDSNKENLVTNIKNNQNTNKNEDLTLNEIISNNKIDINTNLKSYIFKYDVPFIKKEKKYSFNQIINTNNFELNINNSENDTIKEINDNKDEIKDKKDYIKKEGETEKEINEDNINNIDNNVNAMNEAHNIEAKKEDINQEEDIEKNINKSETDIINEKTIEDNSDNLKEDEKENKETTKEKNESKSNIISEKTDEEINKESVEEKINEPNQIINNDNNPSETKEEKNNLNNNENNSPNFVNSIINFIVKEEEKIKNEDKEKNEKDENNEEDIKQNKEKNDEDKTEEENNDNENIEGKKETKKEEENKIIDEEGIKENNEEENKKEKEEEKNKEENEDEENKKEDDNEKKENKEEKKEVKNEEEINKEESGEEIKEQKEKNIE